MRKKRVTMPCNCDHIADTRNANIHDATFAPGTNLSYRVAISGEAEVRIEAISGAELVLIDAA